MLVIATSENSRMTCCDFDKNGINSSSEARNTTQIIGPTEAICGWIAGSRSARLSASVSSTQVPTAIAPKRRITAAKGCGSMR